MSEFELTRGAPYLADLQRLLNLLQEAADKGIEGYSPQRNYPIENFARHSAFVWVELLDRSFTLDYHAGAAITPAADFVCALLNRLDPEIPEKTIITAMRSIVTERRKLGLAKKPKA